MTRGQRRRRLHALLSELGSECEWPGCAAPATQMAHLHSIGMGGRASADTLDNVMRACDDHALLSDGAIPGNRSSAWAGEQLAALGITGRPKAWDVAEALKDYTQKHRPDVSWELP